MYFYPFEEIKFANDPNGLNPYSGGKCISMIFSNIELSLDQRLNPYSGGKGIPIAYYYEEYKKGTKSQSLFRW